MSSASGPSAPSPYPASSIPPAPIPTSPVADTTKTKKTAQSILQQPTSTVLENTSFDHTLSHLPEDETITHVSSTALGLEQNTQEIEMLQYYKKLSSSNNIFDVIDGIILLEKHDYSYESDELQKIFYRLSYDLKPDALHNVQEKLNVLIEQLPNQTSLIQTLTKQLEKLLKHPDVDIDTCIKTIIAIKSPPHENSIKEKLHTCLYQKLSTPSISTSDVLKGVQYLTEQKWDPETLINLNYQLRKILLNRDVHISDLLNGFAFFIQQAPRFASTLQNHIHERVWTTPINFQKVSEVLNFFKNNYGETHPLAIALTDLELLSSASQKNFDDRIILAKEHWGKHPERLAHQLFRLFTIDEINANPQIFDPLIETSLAHDAPNHHELTYHQLYINRCRQQQPSAASSSSTISSSPMLGKDGHHWDCIGEEPPGSGYWVFKLKWQHDYHVQGISRVQTPTDDNIAIFPAVEPAGNDPHTGMNALIMESIQSGALHNLGFRYVNNHNGVYLILPDIDTLQKKWTELYPNLSDFHCASSPGIATPEEFMTLLQNNDVVISTEKEFIHDMTVHCMPSILCMINDPEGYRTARDQIRTEIGDIAQKIRTKIPYPENSYNHAAAHILIELASICYDMFTAQLDTLDRRSITEAWNEGDHSVIADPGRWILVLWKDENIRKHLITIGINEDNISTFNWPKQKLLAIWPDLVRHANETGQ